MARQNKGSPPLALSDGSTTTTRLRGAPAMAFADRFAFHFGHGIYDLLPCVDGQYYTLGYGRRQQQRLESCAKMYACSKYSTIHVCSVFGSSVILLLLVCFCSAGLLLHTRTARAWIEGSAPHSKHFVTNLMRAI